MVDNPWRWNEFNKGFFMEIAVTGDERYAYEVLKQTLSRLMQKIYGHGAGYLQPITRGVFALRLHDKHSSATITIRRKGEKTSHFSKKDGKDDFYIKEKGSKIYTFSLVVSDDDLLRKMIYQLGR